MTEQEARALALEVCARAISAEGEWLLERDDRVMDVVPLPYPEHERLLVRAQMKTIAAEMITQAEALRRAPGAAAKD